MKLDWEDVFNGVTAVVIIVTAIALIASVVALAIWMMSWGTVPMIGGILMLLILASGLLIMRGEL